jgi:hypothetical protein
MRQHHRITRQNGLDTGFERHAEQETGGTTTSQKTLEMADIRQLDRTR